MLTPTTPPPALPLSTREAAELMGVTVPGMRSLARFARRRGIELRVPPAEWLDERIPWYDHLKLLWYRDVVRPTRQWDLPYGAGHPDAS